MKRKGTPLLALLAADFAVTSACGGGGGGGSARPLRRGRSTAGRPRDDDDPRHRRGREPQGEVRIEVGQRVMFVNEDTRSHEMMSDPHPLHTGCPQINEIGDLAPGQSSKPAPSAPPGTADSTTTGRTA